MIRVYMKTRLAVFLAVLTLPGALVAGVCLTPEQATNDTPLETGFAVAIQADQGNGSIDCSAFVGPGGPMVPIDVEQDKTVGTADPLSPILWSVSDPDPEANADVVFIGNSDGSRCTQYYKANARSGFAAAGTKTNKDATLVACTDGFFEEVPVVVVPPVPPVSTVDGCTAEGDAALQDAIDNNPKYDVVIAIGRGVKGDNTAICSDTIDVVDQSRCVDQCITPEPGPGIALPGDPDCTGEGPFPLKCRACELSTVIDSDPFSDDSPSFCWEVLQKVDLSTQTFKKAPGPKSNQVWKVHEYAGSTCYKISGTTDSGYRYAYFVPAGCTP